jgi:hypothetical protein
MCAKHYEEQRLLKRGETCSVDGCDSIAYVHGLCKKHYSRRKIHGTTKNPKKSPLERFNSSYKVNPETGCWMWTGGGESNGYGRISINGKRVKAHQAAWILFLGTMTDNMRDKINKGRQSSRGYNNHNEFLDVCFKELGMADSGMTANQIAHKVHRPVGTVRWHMAIARKELRKAEVAAGNERRWCQ